MPAPQGSGVASWVFNQLTQTANGRVRFALVILREVRIEQLSIENVPAAVIENLDQSLLGMSFLKRLKSFAMREGAFTISWLAARYRSRIISTRRL